MSSRWITLGILLAVIIGQSVQGLSDDELSARSIRRIKGPTAPRGVTKKKAVMKVRKGNPSAGAAAIPTTAPLAIPSNSPTISYHPHTSESQLNATPSKAPVVVASVTATKKAVSKSNKDPKPPALSQNSICSKILAAAAPGLNCQCSVNFTELSANYACSIPTKYCILGNTLCGGSQLSGKYLMPNQSLATKNCISVKASNPTFPRSICVSSDHCSGRPGTLCGCSAQIDGTACKSCNVCPSGRTVQLDCTNIYTWLSTPCFNMTL